MPIIYSHKVNLSPSEKSLTSISDEQNACPLKGVEILYLKSRRDNSQRLLKTNPCMRRQQFYVHADGIAS